MHCAADIGDGHHTTSVRMFPVCTTWEDTFGAVQPHLRESALSDGALEATLNTLRHLFYKSRAAVFVAVRDGALVAFVPFANTAYCNTWWPRAVLQGPRGRVTGADAGAAVASYAALKAEATRRPVETMLPLHRWWTNGSVVCNVMPVGGWGQGFLPELHDMLVQGLCEAREAREAREAPAETPGVPITALFFLNKRDFPLLRRDGANAAVAYVGTDAGDGARRCYETYAQHAPVFSWYVGSNFRDVAMPVVDDWTCDAEAWAALRARHPLAARPPAAVFRGAATGPLDAPANPRVRAVAAADAAAAADLSAHLDLRLTGWNLGRDRVGLNTAGCPEIRFGSAGRVTIRGRPLPALAPYEPLMEQAARARFLVYLDGHCAASRYGTLMHSGAVILRVASEQVADCGDTWIFQTLNVCGAPVGTAVDDPLLLRADHVLVACAEDLPAAVAWALTLPPEMLQVLAANAAAKAPTRQRIRAWWAATIASVARAQHRRLPDGTGAGAAWFTPADPRYAALGVARDGV
jgi:hypothetical protein